jgi:hypothetical protein
VKLNQEKIERYLENAQISANYTKPILNNTILISKKTSKGKLDNILS